MLKASQLNPQVEQAQPAVLMYARSWFPSSSRLAVAFLDHRVRVYALCPLRHPLRHVVGIQKLYPYKGTDSVEALRAAILDSNPTIIVPCDDAAVWHMHELHASDPDLRALIENSLGPSHAYPIIRSRGKLLETAIELGIRVPHTRFLRAEEDLEGWCIDSPAVVKLDGTCGGTGVAIVHSLSEANAEFRRLSGSRRNQETTGLTIQQFVKGRPANTMFASCNGEVLATVTVEVLASQGAIGAAIVIRLLESNEIERATRLLAKKFMLNGFYGLDFILEEGTDAAYLIEMNPRMTQLGHLRLPLQGDLAGALSAKLGTESSPEKGNAIQERIIALFPQAVKWDRKGIYLGSAHHDVPSEQPALYRELLRDAWPERPRLSRIYHYFRLPKRRKMVNWI